MERNTIRWRTVLPRAGVAAFGLFLLIGSILYFGYADRRMIHPPAIAGVVVIAPLAVIAVVRIFRRYKTRNGRGVGIVIVLLLGMATFVFGEFGWVAAINAHFDDSRAVEHRVQVRREWRSRRDIYFVVDSWFGDPGGETPQVRADVATRKPAHVIVTTRAGALGLEWVSNVKVAE